METLQIAEIGRDVRSARWPAGRPAAADALAARAAGGDTRALEQLVEQFQPLMRSQARWAASCLPAEDPEELRDIVCWQFCDLVIRFGQTPGVDFAGYVTRMLPRRVWNYAREGRSIRWRQALRR